MEASFPIWTCRPKSEANIFVGRCQFLLHGNAQQCTGRVASWLIECWWIWCYGSSPLIAPKLSLPHSFLTLSQRSWKCCLGCMTLVWTVMLSKGAATVGDRTVQLVSDTEHFGWAALITDSSLFDKISCTHAQDCRGLCSIELLFEYTHARNEGETDLPFVDAGVVQRDEHIVFRSVQVSCFFDWFAAGYAR